MEQVTAQDIIAWDAGLQTLTDRLSWMFNRPEPKDAFGLMLRTLLADIPRKNSWGLAEHAGLPTPRPFEHLLDGTVWDADLLRDQVGDYVGAGLDPPTRSWRSSGTPNIWAAGAPASLTPSQPTP
jgi:hypothetical protein